MRAQTTAQSNALASARRIEFVRVFAENPDGAFTNMCTLSGRNWFRLAEIDISIDQPIDAATIRFRRDAGATLSLSPTRTDSTLNRNAAAAYAPLLDVSRGIYVEVALLDPAVATTPAAGDWQRIFQGTIDAVDPAGDDLLVTARDLGARLADTWLTQPTAAVVAGAAAQPIETVIQSMLDTALGAGIVTLYTPVSPGYSVTRFGYQREPLMDAIQRLVDSIGWTCRYRWDAGSSSFRLTLAQPPRTKTTPDVSFPASQYQGVQRFAIARALVRNSITIFYTDPTSGRTSAAVNDAASIARYGFRPLIIEESSDSPISSNAEALAMGNALLADLKAPKADGEWTRPLYWPAELNDLIRFPGNGVHFDTNQDLAVVGIHHTLVAEGTSQTTLTLRGTPAGAYLAWLRRGGPTVGGGSPATIDPPTASITSQGATRLDETLFLSGAPGKNAPKTPFQWRYRFSRKTVGAWTAYDSGTLSVAITVPKDPLYITKIDLQVLQADGQSVIATYWVDGRADGLDETTGKVDPGQPLAGTSHFIPRATDVNGMILDPGTQEAQGKELRRLLAKPLFNSPNDLSSVADGSGYSKVNTGAVGASGYLDLAGSAWLNRHLGNIADGGGYQRPTVAQVGYADRAGTGLDTSGYATVGVRGGALIGDQPASRISKQSGNFFTEHWDDVPGVANGWQGSSAATSLANDTNSTMGTKTLIVSGYGVLEGPKLAFNPAKLYRIRCKVRTGAYNSAGAGSSLFYIGVRTYDFAGNYANTNAGACYVCASGVDPAAAVGFGGYKEYVGWFKGATVVGSGGISSASADPTSPQALDAGTVVISPVLHVGYSGTGGTFLIDYYVIDEYDEDGSLRTYSVIKSDAATLYEPVKEAQGKEIRTLYSKPLPTSPDHLGSINDGGGYAKVASSNVDVSGNVIGAAVTLSSVIGTANLSTNQLTVTWSASGFPSGTTFNVTYTVDATTTGNGTSGGLDNTTSGHVFSIGTFPSSTPSGSITVDAIYNGRVIATKRRNGPFAL